MAEIHAQPIGTNNEVGPSASSISKPAESREDFEWVVDHLEQLKAEIVVDLENLKLKIFEKIDFVKTAFIRESPPNQKILTSPVISIVPRSKPVTESIIKDSHSKFAASPPKRRSFGSLFDENDEDIIDIKSKEEVSSHFTDTPPKRRSFGSVFDEEDQNYQLEVPSDDDRADELSPIIKNRNFKKIKICDYGFSSDEE